MQSSRRNVGIARLSVEPMSSRPVLPISESAPAMAYPSCGRFVKIRVVDTSGPKVMREWNFECETDAPVHAIKEHCARNGVVDATAYVYDPQCPQFTETVKVSSWDGRRGKLVDLTANDGAQYVSFGR